MDTTYVGSSKGVSSEHGWRENQSQSCQRRCVEEFHAVENAGDPQKDGLARRRGNAWQLYRRRTEGSFSNSLVGTGWANNRALSSSFYHKRIKLLLLLIHHPSVAVMRMGVT